MIELGELRLDSAEAIAAARRKVAAVAVQLLGDDVAASRLGAVTSSVAKELYRSSTTALLGVYLAPVGHNGELIVEFAGEVPEAAALQLGAFFDRVQRRGGGVTAALGYEGAVGADRVARLQGVVQQKTRDELMQEVREQNVALEESLENLKRTRSARDRLESELNIGREIQMSMLPLKFPVFPDHRTFEIFATLHPAQQVGGDFYDMFLMDEQRLCFCVGDVSGKGVPAALFMAVTKTLIKSFAAHEQSPARILEQVNQEQAVGNESCMFVTILLGVLDINSGELTFSNAGHNPPLLRRKGGDIERLDARHGPIIGAMEDLEYGEDSLAMHPGDLLYLYTDGINEAMNGERELYGEERLLESLQGLAPDASAEAAVQGTVNPVWEYQGDAPQADDVTVLALRFMGETGKAKVPPRLTMALRNEEAEIARAIGQLKEFTDGQGIGVDIQRKLATCLDEMIVNIISYAYEDNGVHEIGLDVALVDGEVVCEIRDDGVPFDPFADAAPDTEGDVMERPIGGLGRHLVKNLMDHCSYERAGDMNITTLRKHLQS